MQDIFSKRGSLPSDRLKPLTDEEQNNLSSLLNSFIVPTPTDYSASPLLPESVDTINSMIGEPPSQSFNMTDLKNISPMYPQKPEEEEKPKVATREVVKAATTTAPEVKEEPKSTTEELPKEDEYDVAKREESDYLRMLGIVRGMEKVGQAIGRSYEPGIDFKALEALGMKPAQDILAKREEASKKLERQSMARDIEEKEASRDPNSATSKNTRMLTRSLLDTAGLSNLSEKISNMSAYEIDKKFPYLSNLISAKQAQDAKALQVSMLKAQKDDARASKEIARDEDWLTNQFQKEVDSPQFKRIERLESDALNIERSLKNPGGIGEIAVLYGFLKSIDENSAVREGEVKLGLEAMNAMERVKAASSNFSSKKRVLSDQMLKDIATIHDAASKNAKSAYNNRMKYVFNQGADRGIPKERMLRSMGMYLEGQPEQETKAQEPSSSKTVIKKQYSPSANKTKLTYSDGTEEILDGRQ